MSATTRFVIFSVARSGTSFLTTSLRSHPQILCHGEALLPRHIPRHIHGSAREVLTEEMCERDPAGLVRTLWEMNDDHPIVGFKVFAGHTPPLHIPLLQDEGIHKIVLKRDNALASWSSQQIARETGRWNARKEGSSIGATTTFLRREFDRYLNRRDKYFAKVDKQCRGPRLDLSYAREIMDQDVSGVLEFLGADAAVETSSNKAKQLGRNVLDRFDNPDEVRAYLEETGRMDWAEE